MSCFHSQRFNCEKYKLRFMVNTYTVRTIRIKVKDFTYKRVFLFNFCSDLIRRSISVLCLYWESNNSNISRYYGYTNTRTKTFFRQWFFKWCWSFVLVKERVWVNILQKNQNDCQIKADFICIVLKRLETVYPDIF